MKPIIFYAIAMVMFILATIQFGFLALGTLLALAQPRRLSSFDPTEIKVPGHVLDNVIWQLAPWLLLVLLAALGFYFRWLSKKFATR